MKKKLILFLPALFAGTFIFAQTPATQAKVKIIFNSFPVSASVEKAPLKYDKDFAYSFTFDDGKADAYTNVHPLFSGGIIKEKGMNLPGLSFSDGCGNLINFKGGLAINSVNSTGFDPHEGSPGSITWNQIKELYTIGWNIFNHSFTHSYGTGTNYASEILQNTNYIKSKTGITTTHFVVPSGDSNYVPIAFNHNMKAVYNQQLSFPGHDGIVVDGPIDLNEFKLFRRFISDENFDNSNIREKIDLIASQSSTSNHIWFTDFTHSVSFEPAGGSILFSTFQNYMNYIESAYGYKGSDRIWMAPLQEVYEYLKVREGIEYSTEVSLDTLILYLDFKNIPHDLDQYALTFRIDAPEFEKVVTENIELYSFNGTGDNKIINIVWKENFITSTLDPLKNNDYCNLFQYSIVDNPGYPEIKINASEKRSEEIQIIIYNNVGNILYERTFTHIIREETISLDSLEGNFSPGVYFIKIIRESSGCEYIRKIILY